MSSRPTWGGLRADVGMHPAELERVTTDDELTDVDERAAGSDDLEDLGVTVYGKEDFILPGFGERGPRCGDWYPEAVCDECGYVGEGTHNCGRKSCPDCWGIWRKQAAISAASEVQNRRLAEPPGHRRQVGHFTWSPDDPPTTVQEVKDGAREAWAVGREKGLRGAAVIPHDKRLTEEAEALWESEGGKDGPLGKWAWLRREYPERMTFEADDPLVCWSPHYHVIGLMSPDMEPGSEDDGGVWELIRTFGPLDGPRDVERHEEVYGTFAYLLSHAAVHREQSLNAVRWYGALNTRSKTYEMPSEHKQSVVEGLMEEIAEAPLDVDEDGDGGGDGGDDDESRECPTEDCGGTMIGVFGIDEYLRQSEPPPEVVRRMEAARDWRMGDREPPPGLKRPSGREEFEEAFESLL